MFQLNKSSDVLLDIDKSGGQGLYDPFLEEPEYCNAGNAALWEMTVLHVSISYQCKRSLKVMEN